MPEGYAKVNQEDREEEEEDDDERAPVVQSAVQTEHYGPNSHKAAKCHDCPCIVLFGLYWVGMFIIVFLAFKYGDTARLVYATDFNGDTCGQDALQDKRYGYYPTLAEDVLSAVNDDACDLASGLCSINLFTICVDSTAGRCPRAGEVICTYERDAEIKALTQDNFDATMEVKWDLASRRDDCWFIGMNMTKKFNRCVPWPEKPLQEEAAVCQEYDAQGVLREVVKSKLECDGLITETITTTSRTTGGADQLLFEIASFTYYFQELFADIVTAKYLIFGVGAGASVIASFAFVLMLSWIAGFVVWMIIINTWLAIGCISGLLFLKAGSFFGISTAVANTQVSDFFLGVSDSVQMSRLADLTATSTDYHAYWAVAAYVFFAVFVVYFCVVCVLRPHIDLCIDIMKSSGTFILGIPTLPFFPLLIYVWQVALLAFCLVMVCLIESVKWFTTADLAYAVRKEGTCWGSANQTQCVTEMLAATDLSHAHSNSTVASSATSMRTAMHLINIFGFLWTLNVFNAVCIVTIATAVASRYWHREGDAPLTNPVWSAFSKTITYHYGSCIFGAFVIAVVQFIRVVLAYIDRKSKALQEQNRMLKVLMCTVKCLLWCFEKIVKYLTRNAFVLVAIEGNSFCSSAVRAFSFLIKNPLRISLVQGVTHIVVFMGKLGITAFCVMLAWFIMEYAPMFHVGGSHAITSPGLPCLVVGVMAFVISFVFMEVYGITSDTLVFSYCKDENLQADGKIRTLYATRWGIDHEGSGFEKASKQGREQAQTRERISRARSGGDDKTEMSAP